MELEISFTINVNSKKHIELSLRFSMKQFFTEGKTSDRTKEHR